MLGAIGGLLKMLRNEPMEKDQREAVTRIVREFIEIKYELSNYVDDGLIELGEQFDKAITKLIEATGTGSLIDESMRPDHRDAIEETSILYAVSGKTDPANMRP